MRGPLRPVARSTKKTSFKELCLCAVQYEPLSQIFSRPKKLRASYRHSDPCITCSRTMDERNSTRQQFATALCWPSHWTHICEFYFVDIVYGYLATWMGEKLFSRRSSTVPESISLNSLKYRLAYCFQPHFHRQWWYAKKNSTHISCLYPEWR